MLLFNASSVSVSTQITENTNRPRRATDGIFGKTIVLNNMQIFCTQWLSKPLGGGRRRLLLLLLLSVLVIQRRNVKLSTRANQLIDRHIASIYLPLTQLVASPTIIYHRKYH